MVSGLELKGAVFGFRLCALQTKLNSLEIERVRLVSTLTQGSPSTSNDVRRLRFRVQGLGFRFELCNRNMSSGDGCGLSGS